MKKITKFIKINDQNSRTVLIKSPGMTIQEYGFYYYIMCFIFEVVDPIEWFVILLLNTAEVSNINKSHVLLAMNNISTPTSFTRTPDIILFRYDNKLKNIVFGVIWYHLLKKRTISLIFINPWLYTIAFGGFDAGNI